MKPWGCDTDPLFLDDCYLVPCRWWNGERMSRKRTAFFRGEIIWLFGFWFTGRTWNESLPGILSISFSQGRVPIVIRFFWNNSSWGSLASQQYTVFFHSFMSDINFHEVAKPSWPLGFCIVLAWLDFKSSTSKIVRNSGNISGYVFQVCFLVWTISPLRVGITLHRWNCQNLGILFLCYWYGWPTQRKDDFNALDQASFRRFQCKRNFDSHGERLIWVVLASNIFAWNDWQSFQILTDVLRGVTLKR